GVLPFPFLWKSPAIIMTICTSFLQRNPGHGRVLPALRRQRRGTDVFSTAAIAGRGTGRTVAARLPTPAPIREEIVAAALGLICHAAVGLQICCEILIRHGKLLYV